MAASIYHFKYWPTWLGIFILRLFTTLLPVRLQYRFFRRIGLLACKYLKRRRHIAEVNIALCFPELSAQQKQQLVQDNFVSTAWAVVEIARSFWADNNYFAANSEVQGLELINQAQQQGKGILLLGLHVTTLEISGRTLSRCCEVDVTYKQAENPAFNAYMVQRRQQFFPHVLDKNEMRKMIRILKNGRMVWFAPDQDFGRNGSVFAPFFHRPAATLSNVGKIQALSGAKVLFYNHYRIMKDGKPYFIGEVSDPFNDGFGEDPVANATLYNKAVADAIRPHPEQYLWVHERFRTQPEAGMPKPYGFRKKKKTTGVHQKNRIS